MRRLNGIGMIVLLALLPFFWSAGIAAGAEVRVSTPVASSVVGDTVSLTVQVDAVTDLKGFQFNFGYDPARLEVTAVGLNGGFDRQVRKVFDNINGRGVVAALALNNPSLVGTPLTLATIDFKVKAGGISQVGLTSVILGQSDGEALPVTTANGTVTATGGVPLPPAVSISSPVAGLIYSSSPLLVYSVSDGTVTVRVDGVASPTVSGQPLAPLAHGQHRVRVEAVNGAVLPGSSEVTFFVDTMAPTLSVIWLDSTHITATYNEPVNGSATAINYTADQGLLITGAVLQSGNSYTLTTSPQDLGKTYTLTASGISDQVGNTAVLSATFSRLVATDNAPPTPVRGTPADGSEVAMLAPTLTVIPVVDPDGDPVNYTFQLAADIGFSALAGAVTQSGTAWITPTLVDNTRYYWRVQAGDGTLNSSWSLTGDFFVNTANDAPGASAVSAPSTASQVASLTPTLTVTNATDVDQDTLTYDFQVATDSAFTAIIAQATAVVQGGSGSTSWTVTPALIENSSYFWRARAVDQHDLPGAGSSATFVVNTTNDAPTAPGIVTPVPGSEVTIQTPSLTVSNATDADNSGLVHYFEIDTVNTFDSPAKQGSVAITTGAETTTWTPVTLADNSTWYWRVRAFDGTTFGPWSTGASFFVNTVNDSPTAPMLANPADTSQVTTLTPTLAVNAAMDMDRDTLTYEYQVATDSGFTAVVAASSGQPTSWNIASALADNAHYWWRVRAVDQHGLAGVWMTAATIFVNNNGFNDLPIVASFTATPSNGTAPLGVVFTLQATDPDGEIVKVDWDFDGDGTFEQTRDLPLLPLTGQHLYPMAGSYPVTIRLTDNQGGVTTANTTITVLPATVITFPLVGATLTGTILTVTGTATGVQQVELSVDGGINWQLATGSSTWSYPWTLPVNGSYTLKCRGITGAGEVEVPTGGIKVTVANPLPVTTMSPAPGSSGKPVSVTLTSTGTVIYYSLDGSAPSLLYSGTPLVIAATTTVSYFALDALGNREMLQSGLFTIVPPPTMMVSTLSAGAHTVEPALNISGKVTSGAGVQSLSLNGATISLNTDGTFSTLLTLALGANTVTLVALDQLGSSTTDIRTVYLDPTAPQLTIIAPPDNIVTALPLLTVNGSVDPQCTVTVTVNGGTAQHATVDGTIYAITLNLVAGLNTVEVMATNLGGGSSLVKRTVLYDNGKPSLSITWPAQDLKVTANNLTIEGTVADALSAVRVTIAVDGQIFTPPVTNGAFSQRIEFTVEKIYSIVVTATDESGNATTVQRNIHFNKKNSGDLNEDGDITVADALRALRIAVGVINPTATDLANGDVAPLVGGKPSPDGVIDVGDALVILRRVVGLVNW